MATAKEGEARACARRVLRPVSEAVLRIARELPRWQWTWIFRFIPRVIRDAIYDLIARNISPVRPS